MLIKNSQKLYSREGGITKGGVADYYARVAPLLLPHITDKPFTMIHYPDGEGGKSFYQKERPAGAPDWLKNIPLPSERRGVINWCLVNDVQSVLYMVNRGVPEMHTWFSRLPDLDRPDVAVVDLDPSGGSGFEQARVLATAFGLLLRELGIFSVPKTSGGRGIHIYIPIEPAPFERVREFLNGLCGVILRQFPELCTQERTVAKRGDKVYLDAVQNARGKTIAAPYSARCRSGFPVSTPLNWSELDDPLLNPSDFNINTIFDRLDITGDLFAGFYSKKQRLPILN